MMLLLEKRENVDLWRYHPLGALVATASRSDGNVSFINISLLFQKQWHLTLL